MLPTDTSVRDVKAVSVYLRRSSPLSAKFARGKYNTRDRKERFKLENGAEFAVIFYINVEQMS